MNIAMASTRLQMGRLSACLALALSTSGALAAASPFDRVMPRMVVLRDYPGRIARAHEAPRRAPRIALVTSCADDGGPDTLRTAVTGAASGDTIDLTSLSCSTISLTGGALVTSADDLTIEGPGADALTIDALGQDSNVIHAGLGTLAISGVTLTNGVYHATVRFPLGGCVYSTGSITLADAIVSTCEVSGLNYAYGGALYAKHDVALTRTIVRNGTAHGYALDAHVEGGDVFAYGNLTLTNSTLAGGTLMAHYDSYTDGGGAYVFGDFEASYSTISGNSAVPGNGGGVLTRGYVSIVASTFSGNAADRGGAIVLTTAFNGTATAAISNSTISGNTAEELVGGIYSTISLALTNSTVAFNTCYGDYATPAGGVFLASHVPQIVQSSIIADNISAGAPSDLTAQDAANLSGSNDLIVMATDAEPAGTIHDDPMLQPLADNGGATRTHAPAVGSPAIDAGNNVAHLNFDQRGMGFARVVGSAADIGAYEWSADLILANGFQ